MEDKARIVVEMPYIGMALSSNHSYGFNKHGRRFTLRETSEWMEALGWQLQMELNKGWQVKVPVKIHLYGKFKDHRNTPDLSNLHTVIANGIKTLPKVPDDKEFLFIDEGYEVGYPDPVLIIGVEVEDGRNRAERRGNKGIWDREKQY